MRNDFEFEYVSEEELNEPNVTGEELDCYVFSGEFPCPTTGHGVQLLWRTNGGKITAHMCRGGKWDTEDNPIELSVFVETQKWCDEFNDKRHKAKTLDGANRIAEKFGTWI